ncbi:glycosyltransferase [Sphingomonas sp. R86520]|uniref:glycosyltransferase n=1 Tax=Sphingomonas sp. R86520 TaxID=3093859 RepID=UPI0036D3897B
MIFASVGSMLPFDRLTRAVDAWAGENPKTRVLIQIGSGVYEPQYAEWTRMMPHEVYLKHMTDCRLFVAHVGIGSILQALELGRQMLMLPRRASLGEHTTDHQLDTATKFHHTAGLAIVDDTPSLHLAMSKLLASPLSNADRLSSFAPESMTNKIRDFLLTSIPR